MRVAVGALQHRPLRRDYTGPGVATMSRKPSVGRRRPGETRGVPRQAPCGPHRLCGPGSKNFFFRPYPSLRSCIDKLHCSVIRGCHVFCLGCSCPALPKTKNSPSKIGLLQKERIVSQTQIFRDQLLLVGGFNPFEKY